MGERVKKGEPLITICSTSDWELESAVKDARRQMPIVVEGMLLERYLASLSSKDMDYHEGWRLIKEE